MELKIYNYCLENKIKISIGKQSVACMRCLGYRNQPGFRISTPKIDQECKYITWHCEEHFAKFMESYDDKFMRSLLAYMILRRVSPDIANFYIDYLYVPPITIMANN